MIRGQYWIEKALHGERPQCCQWVHTVDGLQGPKYVSLEFTINQDDKRYKITVEEVL